MMSTRGGNLAISRDFVAKSAVLFAAAFLSIVAFAEKPAQPPRLGCTAVTKQATVNTSGQAASFALSIGIVIEWRLEGEAAHKCRPARMV